eukprot:63842_1
MADQSVRSIFCCVCAEKLEYVKDRGSTDIQCHNCRATTNIDVLQQTTCIGCHIGLSHRPSVSRIKCPQCKSVLNVASLRRKSYGEHLADKLRAASAPQAAPAPQITSALQMASAAPQMASAAPQMASAAPQMASAAQMASVPQLSSVQQNGSTESQSSKALNPEQVSALASPPPRRPKPKAKPPCRAKRQKVDHSPAASAANNQSIDLTSNSSSVAQLQSPAASPTAAGSGTASVSSKPAAVALEAAAALAAGGAQHAASVSSQETQAFFVFNMAQFKFFRERFPPQTVSDVQVSQQMQLYWNNFAADQKKPYYDIVKNPQMYARYVQLFNLQKAQREKQITQQKGAVAQQRQNLASQQRHTALQNQLIQQQRQVSQQRQTVQQRQTAQQRRALAMAQARNAQLAVSRNTRPLENNIAAIAQQLQVGINQNHVPSSSSIPLAAVGNAAHMVAVSPNGYPVRPEYVNGRSLSGADFGVRDATSAQAAAVICPTCQQMVLLVDLGAHVEAHQSQAMHGQQVGVMAGQQPVANGVNQMQIEPWSCSQCTFENRKHLNYCEVCSSENPAELEKRKRLEAERARQAKILEKAVSTQISHLKKHASNTLADSRAFVQRSFAYPDILQERVPLVCPISQTLMLQPARGKFCTHLSCFDLETHLVRAQRQTSRREQAWMCPICQKMCRLSELYIDGLMLDVLDSVPLECTEVFMRPDASWTPILPAQSRVIIDLTGDTMPEIEVVVKQEKDSEK